MVQAQRAGAKVIAITDPGSQLAQVADLLLACHPTEDTSVFTPMTSRLVQLALLDGLQVALALKMGSTAETRLRLSKDVLNQARAGQPSN